MLLYKKLLLMTFGTSLVVNGRHYLQDEQMRRLLGGHKR